jgi:hypothetical protein
VDKWTGALACGHVEAVAVHRSEACLGVQGRRLEGAGNGSLVTQIPSEVVNTEKKMGIRQGE